MYCQNLPALVLAAAACLAGRAGAQAIHEAPAEVIGALLSRQEPEAIDPGPTVEMFESPNLDRFLRRARQFLDEEKYAEAIDVLQSVIEGRTLVAMLGQGIGVAQDTPAPGDGDGQPNGPEPKPDDGPKGEDDGSRLADPAQTVFSQDGRIYRPARRLCHEYLSRMPPVGLELYRTKYEVVARELLEEALLTGRVSALEHIANNYFATVAAGQAMQILADRHMHEGRYRAAVQVLRDLSGLYPEENLRRLAISKLWCRFKIALCLRLAGEVGAALDAARGIAREYPDESLRLMGELQPISTLAESPYFAAEDESVVGEVGTARRRDLTWLRTGEEDLVPLWQYRFHGNDPYGSAQSRGNDNTYWGEPTAVNAAPWANKYGTGTRIAFQGDGQPTPRAVFLENYRVRVADSFTGLLELEGDESHLPPKPSEGKARSRVPAYDFALQRVVDDGQRLYIVAGYNKTTQGLVALQSNEVVAYDRETMRRLWSSDDFLEGEDSYDDVTFLAAPTVFGERLLTPVLRRGAYALQCMDRATGRPLWRTRLHSGGSEFYRAPGTPVLISGSLAYVLTNAGGLAAVDAFAGDLRWIRRYERADPLRPEPVVRKPSANSRVRFGGRGVQFVQRDLRYFLPSELHAAGGTIVFGGCDSQMLLCVDGASGEPIWMIDGTTKFAPYDDMRYVVGTTDEALFVATDTDLVCIGLRSGLVKWALPLPQASEKLTRWRGRGCVLADHVLMPGDRELLVTNTAGEGRWHHLQLPSFGVGEEPLRGPNNLHSSGPWLGVCYNNGVEVYSTAEVLRELAGHAADPILKANYLVQAGDLGAGIGTLAEWLAGGVEDAAQRRRGEEQLVALAREQALAQGAGGIAVLDRIQPLVADREVRLQWFLARLEFYRQEQDLTAYEQEQQRLYRFMEGKD